MIPFRPALCAPVLAFLLAAPSSGQQLPPAFPREGATKVLENDRVIVWDVQLQKGQRAELHTHPYDIVSVTLHGRRSSGQRRRRLDRGAHVQDGRLRFTPKGRTHFEVGLTDPPRRAIITELKPVAPGAGADRVELSAGVSARGREEDSRERARILWDVTLENNHRTEMHGHPYDLMSVTLSPERSAMLASTEPSRSAASRPGRCVPGKGGFTPTKARAPFRADPIVIEFK